MPKIPGLKCTKIPLDCSSRAYIHHTPYRPDGLWSLGVRRATGEFYKVLRTVCYKKPIFYVTQTQ